MGRGESCRVLTNLWEKATMQRADGSGPALPTRSHCCPPGLGLPAPPQGEAWTYLEDQVAFLQSPGAGSQARLRDVLDEDLTAKFDSKLWGGGKLRQGLGTGSPAHLGAQPLGHNPTGSQASSLHVTLGLSRHEQPM